MDKNLNDIETFDLDNVDANQSATSLVSVLNLINGLTITKSANKINWVDGYLTYKIVITNTSDGNYENAYITDSLDKTVEFVSNSLIIDNVGATEDDYDYDAKENILTIYLNNVDNKTSKIITFQVKKSQK